MRKLKPLIGILIFFTLIFSMLILVNAKDGEVPPYAKWGRIAVKETKLKYPNTDIIDYLHVGRKMKNGSSTEIFKLWLRKENSQEFGVYVRVEFNTETEEIIKITFEETDR